MIDDQPKTLLCSEIFGTEINCIKTKKVYQSCYNTVTEIIDINLECEEVAPATDILCESVAVCTSVFKQNNDVPVLECCIDCIEHTVKIGSELEILLKIRILPSGKIIQRQHKITIPPEQREFFLSRAGEPGLKCQIEVFTECIECNIVETDCCERVTKIKCCIGVLLVAKLYSEIQLTIPSFGYCQLPPTCMPMPVCPEYKPTGIPGPQPIIICPPANCQPKCPATSCPPTCPPTCPPMPTSPTNPCQHGELPPIICPPDDIMEDECEDKLHNPIETLENDGDYTVVLCSSVVIGECESEVPEVNVTTFLFDEYEIDNKNFKKYIPPKMPYPNNK